MNNAVRYSIYGRWGHAYLCLWWANEQRYPQQREGEGGEGGEGEGASEGEGGDDLDETSRGAEPSANSNSAPQSNQAPNVEIISDPADDDPYSPASLLRENLKVIRDLAEKEPTQGGRRPLQQGELIGARQWELITPLGEGTWRAIDAQGNHGVVEEIWPIGNENWMARTQKEALSLSQITHEHIAPVNDWGVDPNTGRWYLTHPYVYGQSLLERAFTQGPLSEAQARAYFLQIISALNRAQRIQLPHRQIRPENIIIYTEEQIVLTRFGVHLADLPAWQWSTDLSPFRRRFIAPEVLNDSYTDVTSEVYSLGATLAFDAIADTSPGKLLAALPHDRARRAAQHRRERDAARRGRHRRRRWRARRAGGVAAARVRRRRGGDRVNRVKLIWWWWSE